MDRQKKDLFVQDRLSLEYITAELEKAGILLKTEIKECVTSTNELLRTYGDEGEAQDMLLLAERQIGGRGRKGRSFFSPEGTGLYMSLLLHPKVPAGEVHMLTPLAAAAVAKALERFTDADVQIKWVNDILIRDRKTVGILTETSGTLTDGCFDYVIVGIGMNVYEPAAGFPEDIRESAGAVFGAGDLEERTKTGELSHQNEGASITEEELHNEKLRSKIAAEVALQFMELYRTFPAKKYLEEYRSRSCLIGKEVKVIPTGQMMGSVEEAEKQTKGEVIYAKVLDVDDACRLLVQYEDGRRELLSSGEVSIRER